jgi:hypothetical protein
MRASVVERQADAWISGRKAPDKRRFVMALSARYQVRIRVQGELGPTWSAAFADLALEPEPDGTTLIRGEMSDQAALHGLLATIRDLGLSLISVETVAAPSGSPVGGS